MPPELPGGLQGRPFVCARPEEIAPDCARGASAAIVDLDLRAALGSPAGRAGLARLASLPGLVLTSPADLARVKELGTSAPWDVLVRPFRSEELARRVARLPSRRANGRAVPVLVAASGSAPDPRRGVETAVSAGTAVLASVFDSIGRGEAPRTAPFRDASQAFVSGLAQAAGSATSLALWLETVRSHHSPTFGHSLTVTANAVLFGLNLGMRTCDLERLSIAGLLHDIGKAVVPLAILDKPARLDPVEAE